MDFLNILFEHLPSLISSVVLFVLIIFRTRFLKGKTSSVQQKRLAKLQKKADKLYEELFSSYLVHHGYNENEENKGEEDVKNVKRD